MYNLSVKKSKNILRSLEFRKNGNYAEVLFKYKNKEVVHVQILKIAITRKVGTFDVTLEQSIVKHLGVEPSRMRYICKVSLLRGIVIISKN